MENSTAVKVKICGITNQADAEAAVRLGADALGFNLWPGSKRHIRIAEHSQWIERLPRFVLRVAVMVNPSRAEAEAAFALPYIDVVQFHGEEDPEFCLQFKDCGKPYIKAVALRDASSCDQLERFGTSLLLLDAYAPGQFGGTGKTIDWELAADFVARRRDLKVLLSGGLRPENVAEAVRRVKPYAVDIASGVERKPGRKDFGRMKALLEAAKGLRGEGKEGAWSSISPD